MWFGSDGWTERKTNKWVGEDWVLFWKGQTSNDLVPGFERVDQAGHCWRITTGDRSGKMAKNHQSHSSADSAT